MGDLFYIIGLLFLAKEIRNLVMPMHSLKSNKKFLERTKDWNKTKEMDGDYVSLLIGVLGKALFIILYMVWTFLGLLGGQWFIFLGLILLGLGTSQLMKISKNENYKAFVISIDGLIAAVMIGYAILNHFHHLDLITF